MSPAAGSVFLRAWHRDLHGRGHDLGAGVDPSGPRRGRRPRVAGPSRRHRRRRASGRLRGGAHRRGARAGLGLPRRSAPAAVPDLPRQPAEPAVGLPGRPPRRAETGLRRAGQALPSRAGRGPHLQPLPLGGPAAAGLRPRAGGRHRRGADRAGRLLGACGAAVLREAGAGGPAEPARGGAPGRLLPLLDPQGSLREGHRPRRHPGPADLRRLPGPGRRRP